MTTHSERTLRRHFLVLTALRWFPGGLMLPVLVLLMQARGLDLTTSGTLFAGFSALVALLELPTGGLADVIGRRQVFLASAMLTSAAFIMLALARDAADFGVALGVFAVGRALSSGPLQAWYVDAVQAVNTGANLQPALAQEGLVSSVSIGLGVLLGGVLPGLVARGWPGVPTSGESILLTLTVPVWLAAALLALATAAIAALMSEPARPDERTRRLTALRKALADVPPTVTRSLRFARRDRGARAILLSVFATGLAVSATELLAPTYFSSKVGDPAQATAIYGGLLTAVFFASGFGSAIAPLMMRLSRGPMRGAAAASVVCALAYAAIATSNGLAMAAAGYMTVYIALGTVDPLRLEQLHHRASPRERSTVLSVESMAQMLGGVVGALTVPRLAELEGFGAGWFACAAVVLLAAGLTAGVRDARPKGRVDQPNSALQGKARQPG